MKVALLGTAFLLDKSTGVSGAQVQNYNLASAFMNRGIDIHYIAITKNKKSNYELINNIKLYWIKHRGFLFNWLWEINAHNRLLNRINPDIVYQRGRSYLTYVAAKWVRKNGKKFIWGSNGEDSCDFWKQISRLHNSQMSYFKKIILFPYLLIQDIFIHKGIKGAHAYVNQTEYQKKRLLENYGRDGIILPSYFKAPQNDEIYNKENIVLWLANLSPVKRPKIFLQLAESCVENLSWRFYLVGGTKDTEYLDYIYSQAKKIQNLEVLGNVPYEDSDKLFAKAALFVNTSLKEGLPNTFIQAWLRHTPVLSFFYDPNNWISSNNLGICTNGEIDKFLKVGKRLINNKKKLEKIGENCYKFALDKFCNEKIIDAYIDLFKKI